MVQYKILVEKILFLLVGSAIVVFALSPINLSPNEQPFPDFLFCFIFIILVRRPESVPLYSILFISLLADLLWYRPIGLTPFTLLLSSEILRWHLLSREKISMLEETIYISFILIGTNLIQEIIKFFTRIPSLELSTLITYTLFTMILYILLTILAKLTKKLGLI